MRRRWLKALGWLVLAILVLGFALPYVSADRLREPLRNAMENALSRKVTLGEMHWNLFTGPGLRADNVVIGEDPALGEEPIAYAGSLVATPSISSLWHGRLECSSLRLEDTHVNVARSGEGASAVWNFTMLAHPKLLAAFPTIRLRGARVNFRINQIKSVFYLFDTDLDIEPLARDGSDWRVRIAGQPARSDRPSRGFGSFIADARWRVQPKTGGQLGLTAKLENSEISDMLQLLRGDDFGLQGHVSGQVTLNGEPSALVLDGNLRLNDLHGWEQVPPSGEAWRFLLNGTLNSIAQELDLHARVPGAAPTVQARLRISHYLADPAWGAGVILARLPLGPLVDVARHLGAPVPAKTTLDGTADGALGYSQTGGFEGTVALSSSRLALAGSAPLEIAPAQIVATQEQIALEPAAISVGPDTGTIDAVYRTAAQQLQVTLRSDGIGFDAIQNQAAAFGAPLLAKLRGGRCRAQVTYQSSPVATGWSGQLHIDNAHVALDGLAEPAALASADVELDNGNINVKSFRGKWSAIAFDGDYQYTANLPQPHTFHLNFGAADAAALERAWLPLLKRQNLLDRALGRTPTPAWLTGWHAAGTVQAQLLTVGAVDLRRFKARLLWDEDNLAFEDVRARVMNGDGTGSATIDVKGPVPAYTANFKLTKAEWQGGRLNAAGDLSTSGVGAQNLSNLILKGTVDAHGVHLAPLDEISDLDAKVDGTHIPSIKMTGPGVSYTGTGEMQPNGQVVFNLTDGTRPVKVAATLSNGVEFRRLPAK